MSDTITTEQPVTAKAKTPDEIQAEINAALAGFTSSAPASKKSEAQVYREAVTKNIEAGFASFVPTVAGFFSTVRTERPEKVLSALKGLDTAKRALLKAVDEISDAAHAEATAPVQAVDQPQATTPEPSIPDTAAPTLDDFDRAALNA